MITAILTVAPFVTAAAGAAAGAVGLHRHRRRSRKHAGAVSPSPPVLIPGVNTPVSWNVDHRGALLPSTMDFSVEFDLPVFFSTVEAFGDVSISTSTTARWAKAGLSTEPADRATAEAGIRKVYQARGLPQPSQIIWAQSPRAAVGIYKAVIAAADARSLSRDELMPDNEYKALVGGTDVLWRFMLGTTANLQLVGQIGREVFRAALATSPAGTLVRFASKDGPPLIPGQFDAESFALHEVGKRARPNRPRSAALDALAKIARSAGPWWPFDKLVIACERPSGILMDQQERPHAEDGPAVVYPDGWGVYFWHGTPVPADLIDGPGWTAKQILTHPNTEVRRAAVERIGWDRFIADAKLAPVGAPVPDPGNPGQELALYDVPGRIYRNPVRVLLCTNGSEERDGTRRRFGLTVPARFTDPVESAAWTFGWDRDDYAALEHRR